VDAQLFLVDGVVVREDGRLLITADEIRVVRAAASRFTDESESSGSESERDTFNMDTQHGAVTDQSCITQAHETLPWGSHYGNLTSRSAHAWVAVDVATDPQVKAAMEKATELQLEEGFEPHHKILAYSDGSVLANGEAGSAAAIVCMGNSDAQATVRLASADVALSSGRAEWGGLIMVLVIATGVSAAIELRLDNLQVVNTFNDGEWRYRRNWLRRNDWDMAMLAWALNDARVRAGKGPLAVIHQLGHP
jgi:ribonuclease HI